MKKIKLTKGKYALVDDDDYEWLSNYKWYACKYSKTFYAKRPLYIKGGRQTSVFMHREILKLKGRKNLCDHINNNGLDNRKINLRACNYKQNSRNKRAVEGRKSKYLGVFRRSDGKKWTSQIVHNGEFYYLGSFEDEKCAAMAYNEKAIELHKEFANINII